MSRPQGGSVSGDINPFTGEVIKSVNAGDWQTASVAELWEQLSVLNDRYYAVASLGKTEYMEPLRLAIANLQETIRHKSQSIENTIT